MPKATLEDLIAELDYPSPTERRRGNRRFEERRKGQAAAVADDARHGERRRGKRRREDRDMQIIGPAWLDQGDS
jgi:hypothetical protein